MSCLPVQSFTLPLGELDHQLWADSCHGVGHGISFYAPGTVSNGISLSGAAQAISLCLEQPQKSEPQHAESALATLHQHQR
eukprot:7388400-Prymnesium_polylepis.3